MDAAGDVDQKPNRPKRMNLFYFTMCDVDALFRFDDDDDFRLVVRQSPGVDESSLPSFCTSILHRMNDGDAASTILQ